MAVLHRFYCSEQMVREWVLLSIGVLGQVWYLIVSITDLCTLTYFVIHYFEQHEEGIYSTINVISSWRRRGQNFELSKQRHVVRYIKWKATTAHEGLMEDKLLHVLILCMR